jgi:mono/diheme cytochrome c family protein
MNARYLFAVLLAVVLLSLSLLAGCAGERQGEPITGAQALTAEEIKGRRVYMRECNGCHPQGAGGLGPALNNKPVPAVAIKIQVREGFGAMPSFSDKEITSEELDALVAFMSKRGASWGG